MDDAMIAKLLSTYGAQPTTKNANAARSFFATNPEIAEKRAMGMRGSGIDDNSDIFGAQLDKFIEASSTPQQQITREELPAPIETVQNASRPAKKATTGTYPPPNEANGTPNNPGTGPITRDVARGGKGFGLDDVLTALLGLRAIIPGATPQDSVNTNPRTPAIGSDRQGQKALPRAIGEGGQALPNPFPDNPRLTYQPKLEDNVSDLSRVPTNTPAPTTTTGDPALTEQAKKAQLQAEIDAENEGNQRLQDQIAERNKKQRATQDLAKAARNATGRR